jgi:hypothetical protein
MKIPYEGKKRFVTFEGDEPTQGFVYDTRTVDTTDDPYEHFFIERIDHAAILRSQHLQSLVSGEGTVWYLIIENQEYLSNDLSELERKLAKWTRDEGVVFGDHITEDIAKPECDNNGHKDTGRGVCAECGTFL